MRELVRTEDTGTLQHELYFRKTTPSVLSLSTATRRPSWIITIIWGTQWPRFFRHALGLEICGTLSPELIEQLKDSPVQVYTPFLED
jgi:hypothetical protein